MSTADETRPGAISHPVTSGKQEEAIPLPPPRPHPNADAGQHPTLDAGTTAATLHQVAQSAP